MVLMSANKRYSHAQDFVQLLLSLQHVRAHLRVLDAMTAASCVLQFCTAKRVAKILRRGQLVSSIMRFLDYPWVIG
jgi:hypothetical protein